MTTTPDPTIRTHDTYVQTSASVIIPRFVQMPANWTPGTPVLVVDLSEFGEGATIKRLCDVPEGWEWQTLHGSWVRRTMTVTGLSGLVVCRPAQPRTEKVPWHEAVEQERAALYDYDNEHGPSARIAGSTWSGRRCVRDIYDDRIRDIDADGMVEVLIEDGGPDDEPQRDLTWRDARGVITLPDGVKPEDIVRESRDEPQVDTPHWVNAASEWADRMEDAYGGYANDETVGVPGYDVHRAYQLVHKLVELVRRDQRDEAEKWKARAKRRTLAYRDLLEGRTLPAEAEVDRMRPIVDAAVRLADAPVRTVYEFGQRELAVDALVGVVDAYRQTEGDTDAEGADRG